MPTDEKDIVELAEGSMRDLYEGLNKMQVGDPKRESIMKEIESHSKIVDSYESRDLRRMDNNAKNDIEEQRVIVDQMKVQNSKAELWVRLIEKAMYFVGAFGVGYYGYHADKYHLFAKPFARFRDDLLTKLGR